MRNQSLTLPFISDIKKSDVNDRIQLKLDKLEELKRQQEELAAEIDNIKKDIGNALVEEDVTIKTSYVSKRLIQGNITHRSVTKYLKQQFYNINTAQHHLI